MDGFTLDPDTGRFLHTHKDIRIPPAGPIYSFNEANFHDFDEPVKRYLDALKAGSSSVGMRYVTTSSSRCEPVGSGVFPVVLFHSLSNCFPLLFPDPTLVTLARWLPTYTMCSSTVEFMGIPPSSRTRMVSCGYCTNRHRWRSSWSKPEGLDQRGTEGFSMSNPNPFIKGTKMLAHHGRYHCNFL